MSHTFLNVQATWMLDRHRIWSATIAWCRSRGPESTRSKSQHVRDLNFKGLWSKRSQIATWRHEEGPIFIGRGFIERSWYFAIREHHVDDSWSARSPSDGRCEWIKTNKDWTAYLINIGWLTWSSSNGWRSFTKNHDRGLIVARSWSDRPTIVADCRVRSHIYGSSTIAARSPCNQSPIARRSWPEGFIAKIGEDSSRDWSHIVTQRNRSHDPCKSLPQSRQLPTILGQNPL